MQDQTPLESRQAATSNAHYVFGCLMAAIAGFIIWQWVGHGWAVFGLPLAALFITSVHGGASDSGGYSPKDEEQLSIHVRRPVR